MSDVKALWLVAFKKDRQGVQTPALEGVMQTLKSIGADGLSANGATAELARALKDAGKELHVWTVNDPKAVGDLLRLGVKSITTDRPDRIREALKKD